MGIFDKYKSKFNEAELKKSMEDINNNDSSGAQREDVPIGRYEVRAEKIECKFAKSSGRPMVSIWFRILTGKFEKSVIFYNAVFHEDWMRHRVVKFLCDMMDDHDHEAEINLILKNGSANEINEFLMDMHEEIDGKLEYLLNYGESKGYKTYAIDGVYETA